MFVLEKSGPTQYTCMMTCFLHVKYELKLYVMIQFSRQLIFNIQPADHDYFRV